ADLVAAVEGAVRVELGAGVPRAGDRLDLVERAVHGRVVTDRVEDVELRLGTEVRGVGDTGRAQVLLRLTRDVARVAGVGLAGERVVHEEVQVQRLGGAERIQLRGAVVGQQQHVRLVDRLETTHGGTVERQPFLGQVGGERLRRDGEVLLNTGKIAEADVDVFDVLIGDVFDDLVGRAERHLVLLTDSFPGQCRLHGRRDQTVWTRCFPAVKVVFRQCYTCYRTGGMCHPCSDGDVILPSVTWGDGVSTGYAVVGGLPHTPILEAMA